MPVCAVNSFLILSRANWKGSPTTSTLIVLPAELEAGAGVAADGVCAATERAARSPATPPEAPFRKSRRMRVLLCLAMPFTSDIVVRLQSSPADSGGRGVSPRHAVSCNQTTDRRRPVTACYATDGRPHAVSGRPTRRPRHCMGSASPVQGGPELGGQALVETIEAWPSA